MEYQELVSVDVENRARPRAWLPAAEFIDRYLVCVTKARRLDINPNDPVNPVAVWLRDHASSFNALTQPTPEQRRVSAELLEVHGQLWDLETAVRSPAAEVESHF